MLIETYLGHPAVLHSEFPGTMGVMCVKKNVDGLAFHFAHNTESFVSLSMEVPISNTQLTHHLPGSGVDDVL